MFIKSRRVPSGAEPDPQHRGRWRLAPALALVSQLLACAGSWRPIRLAPNVDLKAMQGGWYIVATIPKFLERRMVAPLDLYSQRTDGGIEEDCYLRSGGFDAQVQHFSVRHVRGK